MPPTGQPTVSFFSRALVCRLLRVVLNRPVVLPARDRSQLGDRLY
jgi:hypothetical protein